MSTISNPQHEPSEQRKLVLLPGWVSRVQTAAQELPAQTVRRIVPKDPICYANSITYVNTRDQSQALVELARQRPLSCVGVDFEFTYRRPGVVMKTIRGTEYAWHDPRSCQPLLLSLALVESAENGESLLYRFVVDVREANVIAPLEELLRLSVPFVAHFAQAELICLWQLGLPTPQILWDTWVAEKAMRLGHYHVRAKQAAHGDNSDETRARQAAEEEAEASLKLAAVCRRRGISHPFSLNKERLQQSFLTHRDGVPFSREQVEYAAADAAAAAELYPLQVNAAVRSGCLQHLQGVEMPWTITNSRVIWHGIRVAPQQVRRLVEACDRHIDDLQNRLNEMGLNNVNSHLQVQEFFRQRGLLDSFRKGQKYSFDDQQLKQVEDRDPAVRLIRSLRQILRLRSDKLLTGELVGEDGRLHPEHRQLGAASGRNSMRWPNIGGIGRALRPLVVPEEGWTIGEVDLSQIEVGVAAAVYGDPDLIGMFNQGDVYSVMARQYYRDKLPASAQKLSDSQFKKQYGSYRSRMKVFTLSIIYGVTAYGLSVQLGIGHTEAERERRRFLQMFPHLNEALENAVAYGHIRGYSEMCSGLRRYHHSNAYSIANELKNSPIQGSACVVFKAAGNRLAKQYEFYGAKLILPLHDAFVFECRREHLQRVAKTTADVMRNTVQEYFPVLDPQVDMNIDRPGCWNKEGQSRSLRLWMVAPQLALK